MPESVFENVNVLEESYKNTTIYYAFQCFPNLQQDYYFGMIVFFRVIYTDYEAILKISLKKIEYERFD